MELLFPLILVALLVPMFLSIRKQKREAAKVGDMQESLKAGDRVITTSGLYGTIVEVDETTVDLEIAEDVVTTWLRLAIREVRTDDAESSDVETTAVETTAVETKPAESQTAAVEAPSAGAVELDKD